MIKMILLDLLQLIKKTNALIIAFICCSTFWFNHSYAQIPNNDYPALIQTLQQTIKQTDNNTKQTLLHSQLGDAYFANQQLIKAEKSFYLALKMARQQQDPHLLIHVLNNQANLYSVSLEDDKALQAYEEVQKLAIETQDHLAYVKVLLNRLRLNLRRKDKKYLMQDWQQLNQSLLKLADTERNYHQLSQVNLGLKIVQLDPKLIAKKQLQNTLLTIIQDSDNQRYRSQAYGLLAQSYAQQQQTKTALQLTQKAVFFAQNIPDLHYYWQWQQARLLQKLGQLKAAEQSYALALKQLQFIRKRLTQGRRDALDIFAERIRPVYFDYAAILLKKAETAPLKQQQSLLKQALHLIEQLKSAELENYFQDECVAKAKTHLPTDIQLPSDTAVLYPIMLSEYSLLILQTKAGIQQIKIPQNYQTLNQTALSFHYNLQNSASNRFIFDAKQLYEWLITPIKAALEKSAIKTLVLVPDGALRLIPIAALYNGAQHQFLISEYAIAITPSLQLTDTRKFYRPNLKILVNGLSQSVQEFAALPNVPAEVNSIKALFKNSQILMNQDFSTQQFSYNLQNNNYEIVHIASHGQFNRDPRKTFLLTHDGKVTMSKLEQLLGIAKKNDQAIELLTLSACQTAVGDDRAALGLAGVAIKAGARSALASLWFVNDAATSELVVRFYQHIQKEKLSKASALRQAQLELLEQRIYRHPAYWAAFVLIGNWQ